MKYILYISLFLMVLAAAGCKDESNPIPPVVEEQLPNFKAGEIFLAGAKVTLYADDSLRVGYNKLYIRLTDSAKGTTLNDVELQVTPVMHMMTHTHSSPVIQPEICQCGISPFGAVFTMPSGDMGEWSMRLTLNNRALNRTEIGALPVTVLNTSHVKVVTASNGSSYVLTYVPIKTPKVGINDVSFFLHKKETMMEWPAVTNAEIIMTPDMPSMGHGSPNNVNPVHASLGEYKGKVNFTMTGEWRITCQVNSGADSLFTTSFTLIF
ncbi:MAG: hypothetical protein AMXMBFR48_22590 [Ignavibacteriales bacterium]